MPRSSASPSPSPRRRSASPSRKSPSRSKSPSRATKSESPAVKVPNATTSIVRRQRKRHDSNSSAVVYSDDPDVTGVEGFSQGETEARDAGAAVYVNSNFFDDGTVSFFWRPHTLTMLAIIVGGIIYAAFYLGDSPDPAAHVKRGLTAALIVYLITMTTHLKDGPFYRPHPAVWRLVLALSIIYLLFMVFLLFQSFDNVRKILTAIDPSLHSKPVENNYCVDCSFLNDNYTWFSSAFLEKIDIFVFAHAMGWWAKALIIRDRYVLLTMSVAFEFLELTFTYHLPNFAECWWDHWILDLIICNWGGLELGMATARWLEMKEYCWRGLWSISTYKGKLRRAAAQFTPYKWDAFHFDASSSLKRFISVTLVVFVFLLNEWNAFYLKAVLWLPHDHWFNIIRLYFWGAVGAVAMREAYDFWAIERQKTLGQQAWLALAMIVVEFLVVIKFGGELWERTMPTQWKVFWALFATFYVSWTIWWFGLKKMREKQKREQKKSVE